jgi:hypothetical protein
MLAILESILLSIGLKFLRLFLSFDYSLRNLPFLQYLQSPSRLEEGGRKKRKRVYTERYEEGIV